MTVKEWMKDLFTIPNLLSFFRLILIPVYVIIYLNADSTADYYISAAILAVSCLTDMIDGKIARHFNMISNTGKVLDPLADKCTQFTLIICLAIRYPLLWILAGLFFIKEIYQLIAAYVMLHRGKVLNGALMAGKVCTTVLFISLILMVMLPDMGATAVYILGGINLLFLLYAFGRYIWVYAVDNPMLLDVQSEETEKKAE